MLCCTVLYCTVLYCAVLYCTVLYCTVLCCIMLSCQSCAVLAILNIYEHPTLSLLTLYTFSFIIFSINTTHRSSLESTPSPTPHCLLSPMSNSSSTKPSPFRESRQGQGFGLGMYTSTDSTYGDQNITR